MLVLNRKEGQTIEVPELGLTVEVLQTGGGKVKLGIRAPRDLTVMRGELQSCGGDANRKTVYRNPVATAVAEPSESYCMSM